MMDYYAKKEECTKQYIAQYLAEIKREDKLLNLSQFESRIKKQFFNWSDKKGDKDILLRQMSETLNEVCLAHYLCIDKECISLNYEEVVGASGKSIDFVATYKDKIFYLDVKTIHPKDIDAWDDFNDKSDKNYIDGHVSLFEDGGGGVFWHKMKTFRRKTIEYTKEFEDKITEHGKKNGYYFMVFCGNGHDWHDDELEDFIEYYFTGRFISWDHLRTMTKFYLEKEHISFNRSISNFSVLFRDDFEKEYEFYPFVRAEKKFRTYI